MTRRKCVCLKWTLVLLVVVVCPSVYSRPQEVTVTSKSDLNVKSPQAPIRYRYKHNISSLSSHKLVPIVISLVNNTNNSENVNVRDKSVNLISLVNNDNSKQLITHTANTSLNRRSRVIHSITRNTKRRHKPRPTSNKIVEDNFDQDTKKPVIRKVITKWRDKTQYDDLDFSSEHTTPRDSDNNKKTTKFNTSPAINELNTESYENLNSKRYTMSPYDSHYSMYNKPRPQYSEESHVYSSNIQVMDHPRPTIHAMDYPRPTRPVHFYTNIPTPTPVITNVGYPKPWTQSVRKTTTQRYEYHNNLNNHGGNYEVTTIEPSGSYTDKIVIRPEEYSPFSEDCPTIFLTLNNTFQGKGKEACPDLNIAVNTNVVNKNVVVETEEEDDDDSLFSGLGLGLGGDSGLNLGDDSGVDSSKDEDYTETVENNEPASSASIEGTELANYHSVNSPIQSESAETVGNGAAASSPLSAITKPSRPGGGGDDLFSFSALADFFRPALNALGWLVTVNPLSIPLFPFLIGPLGLLLLGSGLAGLVVPWFLPIGREAPKVVHVYSPEWQWDDYLKTWQLHSFPNNRRIITEFGRADTESKPAAEFIANFLSTLQTWMIDTTNRLRRKQNNNSEAAARRTKRRRRETWTTRVK